MAYTGNISSIESIHTSPSHTVRHSSAERRLTNRSSSRSPFKRSRGLLAVLRQKFASKSAAGSTDDASFDKDGEVRPHFDAKVTATLCSSWRSRPRHVDKPIRPAYSDECLSCCATSRCIRTRSHRHRTQHEVLKLEPVPAPSAEKRCGGGGTVCKHCHCETEPSPKDFVTSDCGKLQSDDEKSQDEFMLPVDKEYGHAMAPTTMSSQSATWDMSSIGATCQEITVDLCAGSSCSSSADQHGFEHDIGTLIVESHSVPRSQPYYDQVKEHGKVWSLSKELFKLSKFGWYWGPITRVEAEEKLANQLDGAFLVRDSSDDRYLLSLSFRSYGRTLHTRIEHCNGVFSFYAQHESEGYSSIVDLIENSMTDSQSGVFCYSRARMPGSPSFPVRLAKPVSRFAQVRSLQYLCRFIIRQYTRVDHIQQLPLPNSIKGWLEEGQY